MLNPIPRILVHAEARAAGEGTGEAAGLRDTSFEAPGPHFLFRHRLTYLVRSPCKFDHGVVRLHGNRSPGQGFGCLGEGSISGCASEYLT